MMKVIKQALTATLMPKLTVLYVIVDADDAPEDGGDAGSHGVNYDDDDEAVVNVDSVYKHLRVDDAPVEARARGI